jgi:hypothetical protein
VATVDDARRLIAAKYKAERQPMLHLAIVKICLYGADDSALGRRTW